MKARIVYAAAILPILVVLLLALCAWGQSPVSREKLIEDTRQLARTIESVHPDPYINGGGKIAFHRRLQNIIGAIPNTGLPKDAYYRLLRPFIAAIGDSHTWLYAPYAQDPSHPGGIPLYFDIVDTSLFVAAVPSEEQRPLIGALLVSVEGVPFAGLVDRQRALMPAENVYLVLRNLAGSGALLWDTYLADLLPEWKDRSKITVVLQHPGKPTVTHVLDIPERINFAGFMMSESTIKLPSRDRCDFVYDFIDSSGQTALLMIDDMMTYRESFEMLRALGVPITDERTDPTYTRYHGTEPPADINETIAGLPAVTDVFRSLVIDMKAAGTRTLLIDLRMNGGGNSTMSNILLYFLYGREKLQSLHGRNLEIWKYSPEYFAMFGDSEFVAARQHHNFALDSNDYDFRQDYPHNGYPGPEAVRADLETVVAQMPTFRGEYDAGTYDGYYLPENVVVLCSPFTFSSGYTLLYYLNQAGATVLGTSSAQAGNSFGDIMRFTLQHSELRYQVSRKYFEQFPGDPERGTVLRPEYQITPEILTRYNYDPNTEIRYAIDLFAAQDSTKR
ncbi:MAG: hypothetical protein KKA42_06465 [candidate division Zixibacteria bacterium]|nr:hypothetical protein [candidate division Zixibacteria bacterium]